MSFVEVVFLDWKRWKKHHGVCVVNRLAVSAGSSKERWLHIRAALVARATLPLPATHNEKEGRSTHYCELQYDADWPEVLTEGEMCLYERK